MLINVGMRVNISSLYCGHPLIYLIILMFLFLASLISADIKKVFDLSVVRQSDEKNSDISNVRQSEKKISAI